ncbi:MAG: S41 family peptidase [Candidatus Levybacteria bacterium]|nr:S41 family peptidase [Candidatus Levybacteria bacterium]
MKPKFLQFFLIAAIFSLFGYYFGVSKVSWEWKNYQPKVNVINREPPTSISTVDFSLFWTVWQKLQFSYYDKKAVDPNKLLNGAISGMVQSVGDPYTVFLPPVQNNDFKQGLAGQFQGIGAELGVKGKQIIVVAPLDGSPAQKAGIKAGDAILKVNGALTEGWNLSQAVEKIRGPKGTDVILTILHKDASKTQDIKITRDTITVKSVSMWVKKTGEIEGVKIDKKFANDEIAYIRLSQFGDNTNQEWLSLANKLSLDIAKDNKIKGLVLDLRNNPGGYLTDATFIASEFIKSGTVVIQDTGNGETTPFTVLRKGLLADVSLVVLINKGSASASEIVAGALRDYERAKLVGETSFGKGTIQQAEDLGNGAGLHVTIAKWLTPKGIWVHGKGLTPDYSISLDAKDLSHDTQLEKAIQILL